MLLCRIGRWEFSMYGYRYRRTPSAKKTTTKTPKVVKDVPALDAFIAAAAAYRINGNTVVKETRNNYNTDSGQIESVTLANKAIIQDLLCADDYQSLFTDEDRREGEAIQAYWRMKMFAILSGNASEYIKTSVGLASLQTIKINEYFNLACIASLPLGMERGLERDKKDEIKQDAQLISQHFGNVGDKVIGKVTILDCFFSQKWQCFYVTGSYGTNMVMWASSKELKAGTEHTFTGRIKRHRDNNITQLNFVRIT